LLYNPSQANLEDIMKSSTPLAAAGILSCILIAGCVQTHQASAPNPPADSYQIDSFELQNSGNSQTVRGALVTATFLQTAKVLPLLGRGFLPEEYSSSRHQVVMFSYHFWQQRFDGNPRIVGTTIHLNGQSFTVIGIMPTTFDFPSAIDLWVPKAG
jgi:hypothetical protein